MKRTFALSEDLTKRMRCPGCRSRLETGTASCRCTNSACAATFPVCDGIPVLIAESKSVFTLADLVKEHAAGKNAPRHRIKELLHKLVPGISLNLKAKGNFAKLVELLLERERRPRVLILGGGRLGVGIDVLVSHPAVDAVETDVAFGPRTSLVCDSHEIPFEDGTFDAVVIQAVIDLLADPYHCVEEIYRVLKSDGLVYAETGFLQQVHNRCDFTRFTLLGHRRLFRQFAEIRSGAVVGPGMALAWTYRAFLLSFVRRHRARQIVGVFASLTAFWLKYVDYFLIDRPGSLDAAAGYYFMGRKSSQTLADRELLSFYRGCYR